MADEAKKYLKAAYKEISQRFENLNFFLANRAEPPTRTELYRILKYQQLMETIEKVLGQVGNQTQGLLDSKLIQIFETTLDTVLDDFKANSTSYSVMNQQQLEQTVKASWQGDNYSNRVWRNTNELANRLKEDITRMVINGTNPQDIMSSIRYDFGVAYNVAERLIRTEASHCYNTAALEGYKMANVQQVEVLEAKDDRTCDKCKKIAGRYYMGQQPSLPIHARCRCCYVPIIEPNAQKQMALAIVKEKVKQNGNAINQG